MSSHMQRELEAERPEWYRRVLACLRGEIALDQVPEERRWMCVEHRPPDRRRVPDETPVRDLAQTEAFLHATMPAPYVFEAPPQPPAPRPAAPATPIVAKPFGSEPQGRRPKQSAKTWGGQGDAVTAPDFRGFVP